LLALSRANVRPFHRKRRNFKSYVRCKTLPEQALMLRARLARSASILFCGRLINLIEYSAIGEMEFLGFLPSAKKLIDRK
jgi:hypothetical protein